MTTDIDVDAVREAVTNARDECDRALALLDGGGEILPPDTPTDTTYGACPSAPGYSIPAVIDKFGPCDLRIFDGGKGASFKPPRPEGAGLIHVSWKLFNKSDTPRNNDEWNAFVERVSVNLVEGDIMEAEHEHDVKYRKAVKEGNPNAQRDLDTRMSLKMNLDNAVQRVRPDLRTCSTVAVWTFSKDEIEDHARFMAQATMLGVDFDGMKGQPNFVQWIDPSAKAADDWYGGWWTVPEYGMEEGSNRLPELKRQTPLIAEAGPVSIMYWDDDNGTYGCELKTDDEIEYWSGLCARP